MVPFTVIRHENGAFRKRSSNRRNLKTPGLHFRVDGEHFENEAFHKRWRQDNHVISSTVIAAFSNLMCFQSETSFFNSSDVVHVYVA